MRGKLWTLSYNGRPANLCKCWGQRAVMEKAVVVGPSKGRRCNSLLLMGLEAEDYKMAVNFADAWK
jgi:hypothetical protein